MNNAGMATQFMDPRGVFGGVRPNIVAGNKKGGQPLLNRWENWKRDGP